MDGATRVEDWENRVRGDEVCFGEFKACVGRQTCINRQTCDGTKKQDEIR